MTLYTITVWYPDGERLTFKEVKGYSYMHQHFLQFQDAHGKHRVFNLPHEIREQ